MKKKVIGILVCMLLFATFSSVAVTSNVSETNSKGSPVEEGDIDWWPMYRHDPAHTGSTTSTAPTESSVVAKWTAVNLSYGTLRTSPTS